MVIVVGVENIPKITLKNAAELTVLDRKNITNRSGYLDPFLVGTATKLLNWVIL